MSKVDRRTALQWTAAGAVLATAGRAVAQDEQLTAKNLRVRVAGISESLAGVRKIAVGATRREVLADPASKEAFLTQRYGAVSRGDLVLTLQQGPENKPLKDWADQKTTASRRDVSVFVSGADKSKPGRIYHAKECFPVSFTSVDASTVQLVCKVGYVEVE